MKFAFLVMFFEAEPLIRQRVPNEIIAEACTWLTLPACPSAAQSLALLHMLNYSS